MTNIEYYYNELWKNTLKSVYNTKQIDESIFDQFFNGSRLLEINEKGARILVPGFIHLSIMAQHKDLIEDCLKEQLNDDHYIPIEFFTEDQLKPEKPVFNNNSSYFDRYIDSNQNFGNFVIGKSNMQAHVAAQTVCNNLGICYNPLFIYGNSGLGKTHLLNAIGNRVSADFPNKRIGFISALGFIEGLSKAKKDDYIEDFKNSFYDLDLLLVDDIQFLEGKKWTQEVFFSIFSNLVNNKRQICITADRSPDDIKGLEERIISRFNQGLNVNIKSPEYETSIRILEMKISNNTYVSEKMNFDDDVLSYIATNFSQDVRALEGAVNRLLFYYINFNFEHEDHITLRLATEAFRDQIIETKNDLSISKVRKVVCDYYNLTKQQICSSNRTKNIAIPRHIAMYLCRKLLDAPYKEIGNEFGKRDHSTVISACEKVESLIKSDPAYLKAINEIENRIS